MSSIDNKKYSKVNNKDNVIKITKYKIIPVFALLLASRIIYSNEIGVIIIQINPAMIYGHLLQYDLENP